MSLLKKVPNPESDKRIKYLREEITAVNSKWRDTLLTFCERRVDLMLGSKIGIKEHVESLSVESTHEIPNSDVLPNDSLVQPQSPDYSPLPVQGSVKILEQPLPVPCNTVNDQSPIISNNNTKSLLKDSKESSFQSSAPNSSAPTKQDLVKCLQQPPHVDESSEISGQMQLKKPIINIQAGSPDKLIPASVKDSHSSWGEKSIKIVKWNQELIDRKYTNQCDEQELNTVNKRIGWYPKSPKLHTVNNMTGWSANPPKTVSMEISDSKKTLKSVPKSTINEKWGKWGWGNNPNPKPNPNPNVKDKTDTLKLMSVLVSDGSKPFFSPCAEQKVCHNSDLTKIITDFFGKQLFDISTKDAPTLDELDSVEDICERNIILFKIDYIYKTKLLFTGHETLLYGVIEHKNIIKQLCKYLFTNQVQIMAMWLENLNASCENRTSDICTGVAFDPLEERYYQGFFIALCHNMSLLLNILNDSFSGPCPLSLVRSVDSGTPSEWNKLFKLDEMFEIPRDNNSYCKSKNCTIDIILLTKDYSYL